MLWAWGFVLVLGIAVWISGTDRNAHQAEVPVGRIGGQIITKFVPVSGKKGSYPRLVVGLLLIIVGAFGLLATWTSTTNTQSQPRPNGEAPNAASMPIVAARTDSGSARHSASSRHARPASARTQADAGGTHLDSGEAMDLSRDLEP